MDAVKYLKERIRMCERFECCYDCPLYEKNNGRELPCRDLETIYPEEAAAIIGTWSRENPLVTNKMKFEEVFGRKLYDEKGCVLMADWLSEEYKESEREKK